MKLNYFKILTGLVLIVISAYVSFDISVSSSDIPFTLQSLMVFVVAASMKPRDFLICMVLYLVLGIFGLPVFAKGSSGFEKIVGSSGGFLYGFLASGYFISSYFTKAASLHWVSILTLMLQATVMLFFFGLIHLSILHGFNMALEYGLYPFWKMAIVKMILSALIVYFIKLKFNKL